MNVSSLEIQLLVNPKLKLNEVKNVSFSNHQEFGATKVRINRNRKKLNKALAFIGSSQKEFAKEIGISQPYISHFVNGKELSVKNATKLHANLSKLDFNKVSLKRKKSTKPSNQIIKGNNYINGEGEGKQVARDLMHKVAIDSKKLKKPILTMPSYDPILEKQLNEKTGKDIHFVGCELDKETFKLMGKKASEYGLYMETRKGYVSEVINEATESKYSHAFLDYCGHYATIESDIISAMQRNIVDVNGTISITVSINRDAKSSKLFTSKVSEDVLTNIRNNDISLTEQSIFYSVLGLTYKFPNYKIEATLPYKDKSPMYLIVLKRVS